CVLPVDRAVRAAGPEARGLSQPQALVRGDQGAPRDREGLRVGEVDQHGAEHHRRVAQGPVRPDRLRGAVADALSRVMRGLVPRIHALLAVSDPKTWMAGTSPRLSGTVPAFMLPPARGRKVDVLAGGWRATQNR